MQIQAGLIVCSLAGHDKGQFYLVMAVENDCVMVCDGKLRSLARPKRKNPKHLACTAHLVPLNEIKTDRSLRAVLWKHNYGEEAGARV